MSKAGLIVLLGLLSALLPFVGIPTTTKTVLAVIFGLVILALGFLVREEKKWIIRALEGDHQTDAYTENGAREYGQNLNKTR